MASPTPTTAGIFKVLAIIAECDVSPPISVIKPIVLARSKPTVSLGVRSYVTIIAFSFSISVDSSVLDSNFRIRVLISFKSAARSLI